MFRTLEENMQFVKQDHTGKEWCEVIVDMLEDAGMNNRPTPEQVWNYSATGELSYVFGLIEQAKQYWDDGEAGAEMREQIRDRN